MKIKLNIKRYPFYKELVELAISNENQVFYKEADGSLSKIAKYEGGYQIGGRYYYTLLSGKYIIKGLLPVEMPAKFVEIVNSLPYMILYKGELITEMEVSEVGSGVYRKIALNDYVEDFVDVIKNIEYLKFL